MSAPLIPGDLVALGFIAVLLAVGVLCAVSVILEWRRK